MNGRERIISALTCRPVDRTPVWFMRQAGRCLASYRELREQHDILEITRTPELCAQVTLMPVQQLKVDAAVMYADIMLPLFGMGVPFSIDPGLGPIIHEPVRRAADVEKLKIVAAEEATPDLFQAIRIVRSELADNTALVGFAGAPFTVASYLVEGRPSRDHGATKAMIFSEPQTWHKLMETLTEVTIRYLRAQVDAGIDAFQLFDSWAGALGVHEYEEHVLPYIQRIFSELKSSGLPAIYFATGCSHLLEITARAGADALSVDWRLPLDVVHRRIKNGHALQGNLDPAVMLSDWETIAEQARVVLREAEGLPGHVFNLGHGVLAETDPGKLERLVELVHAETARN